VKIIVGIVLAMRYVHSQEVIHRDLTPENILLDWDWNIRIADFGRSTSPEKPWISSIPDDSAQVWPSGNSHYLAPECYDSVITPENDVFSFGLILYELIVGKPAIPKTMDPHKVGKMLVMEDWKPDIPNFVLPQTKELILDCLLKDYRYRLLFSDIFDRMKSMRFKLIPGVNSSKLVEFVKEIQAREAANLTQ
jgi:serine/threonine protein kinase